MSSVFSYLCLNMIVLHLYFKNKFKHQHSIASIDSFNLVIPLFFICTLNTNSGQRVQEARVPATLCVLRAVLAFSFYLSLSRINEIFKYGSPSLNYLRESLFLLCILVAVFLFAHCTSRRWWLPGTWCVGAYLFHHLDVNSSSPDLAGCVRCQPRQS